jgi:peptide-methionine (S)-S-oxide reductase
VETAMFAAGCFWGVEDVFMQVKGVVSTTVGYSGGTMVNPTYKDVCTDKTGHAEVVLVEFDPREITFKELLDVLWDSHDPTTVNRQGPDVGTQYRSAVFYFTPQQKTVAEASKEQLQKTYPGGAKVVTEITKAGPFYKAEEYHQKYFQKNGGGACHAPHLTRDN